MVLCILFVTVTGTVWGAPDAVIPQVPDNPSETLQYLQMHGKGLLNAYVKKQQNGRDSDTTAYAVYKRLVAESPDSRLQRLQRIQTVVGAI